MLSCKILLTASIATFETEYAPQSARASRPTPELVNTTEAFSDFCNSGNKAWVKAKGARKLTAITSSHTSAG